MSCSQRPILSREIDRERERKKREREHFILQDSAVATFISLYCSFLIEHCTDAYTLYKAFVPHVHERTRLDGFSTVRTLLYAASKKKTFSACLKHKLRLLRASTFSPELRLKCIEMI